MVRTCRNCRVAERNHDVFIAIIPLRQGRIPGRFGWACFLPPERRSADFYISFSQRFQV